MKINGVEFTPQEEECIRIALDNYQDEMEEAVAYAKDEGSPALETRYSNEVQITQSTREKFRQVTFG